MGLVPYAALDVLRNRRRTVSSIIGVLLAVSFVAGTFIAIDSSARATLDATLAGIPGDFSFSLYGPSSSFNYSTLEQAILEVGGVVNASVYETLPIGQLERPGHPESRVYASTLAIDPDHLPSFIRDSKVSGSLALPRGSVGLSRDLAAILEAGIGDSVLAVYQENETIRWEANLTVRAVLDNSALVYGGTPQPPYSQFPYYQYYSLVVVHLRDVEWLLTQLNQSTASGSISVNGEVWIDRAAYVNPYDIESTTRNLERIQRRLVGLLGTQVYNLQNNILSRIQDFSNRIAGQRIQFFIISTPVVLLGVYLGAVGVDLSHAERRRELAILKTRGARRGQLVGLLIMESVVGGIIAAAIGLALGVGVSRLLIGIVNPPTGSPPAYGAFNLTTDTILTISLLSILLMAAVTYRSAKRTAGLSIIETLRYYAPGETKIQYRPNIDIVLVAVGVLDYGLVLWRSTSPTSLWTFLLGIVPFLLLPFVPLMLIVGSTRLLTRGTGKVYDWFSHAAKPFVGDLYYVVRRNLVRNPRRSSNVAIIIALGLAFGTFTLSTLATQDAHTVREIRGQIGADMAVSPIDARLDLTPNLTTIPGVAGVAVLRYLPYVSVSFSYAAVYGIDPDSYFAVAQPESWYFPDQNPAHARDILATRNRTLVSQSFYDQAFVEVGDRIVLSATTYDRNGNFTGTVQTNVTIGGIVRALPGMGFGYSPTVIASLDTLGPFLGPSLGPFNRPSDQYLVDLAPGADWHSVKPLVIADPNVAYATVADEQVELLAASPFARALYQFISMEIVFIGIILTAGVGLILYAASLERDVEFAAIIARGSSGWQTAKLLVGEAFVIMLVGLVIGVTVGTATAYFATQFLASGPVGVPAPAVPYFFVFPIEALFLVVIGPAAMLLSAIVVSVRTARMNVAQVLKLRGG
ncbi:MAG TPA: FtsX-like permease family protein [Thermoplasmata archaeon]|nr:FtsX-like permease family protein [Thermoplasmata archaeon]